LLSAIAESATPTETPSSPSLSPFVAGAPCRSLRAGFVQRVPERFSARHSRAERQSGHHRGWRFHTSTSAEDEAAGWRRSSAPNQQFADRAEAAGAPPAQARSGDSNADVDPGSRRNTE
jgi:hypothetical protein